MSTINIEDIREGDTVTVDVAESFPMVGTVTGVAEKSAWSGKLAVGVAGFQIDAFPIISHIPAAWLAKVGEGARLDEAEPCEHLALRSIDARDVPDDERKYRCEGCREEGTYGQLHPTGWRDAIVVRDCNGDLYFKGGDCWVSRYGGEYTASGVEAYPPITVIIDAEGKVPGLTAGGDEGTAQFWLDAHNTMDERCMDLRRELTAEKGRAEQIRHELANSRAATGWWRGQWDQAVTERDEAEDRADRAHTAWQSARKRANEWRATAEAWESGVGDRLILQAARYSDKGVKAGDSDKRVGRVATGSEWEYARAIRAFGWNLTRDPSSGWWVDGKGVEWGSAEIQDWQDAGGRVVVLLDENGDPA